MLLDKRHLGSTGRTLGKRVWTQRSQSDLGVTAKLTTPSDSATKFLLIWQLSLCISNTGTRIRCELYRYSVNYCVHVQPTCTYAHRRFGLT